VISKLTKASFIGYDTAVAYFYCDGNYIEKQNPRFIIGSILRQLLERSFSGGDTSFIEGMTKFYEAHKGDSFKQRRSREYFLIYLLSVSSLYSQVFVVIDGLDECQPREDLLELLMGLKSCNVNLFVTSRPEVDIDRAFVGCSYLEMESDAVNDDITAYIDFRLDEEARLNRIRPQLKDEIKSKLLEKAEGM
jgi:hypothetical protein